MWGEINMIKYRYKNNTRPDGQFDRSHFYISEDTNTVYKLREPDDCIIGSYDINPEDLEPVPVYRPEGLATPQDVGKLVAFFDHLEQDYIVYGVLFEIHSKENRPYVREGDYSEWKYARRLTQKEKETLI